MFVCIVVVVISLIESMGNTEQQEMGWTGCALA